MDSKIIYFIEQARNNDQRLHPYRHSLAIQLTDACHVGCKHCILSCGIGNNVTITPVLLAKTIIEWKEMPGAECVGFSGGEPFLFTDLLCQGIRLATSHGLRTRVTTSAFWASSLAVACKVLEKLSGLSELFISIDRHHQERIPASFVINALNACGQFGIVAYLQLAQTDNNTLLDLLSFSDYLYSVIDPAMLILSQVVPVGRAANLHVINSSSDFGCTGLDVPMVLADGSIWLCCTASAKNTRVSPFWRGNLNEVPLYSALKDSEEDYWLIQSLRAGGPVLISNLLGIEPWQCSKRQNPCQVCTSILADDKNISRLRTILENDEIRSEIALMLARWRHETEPLIRYTSNSEVLNANTTH